VPLSEAAVAGVVYELDVAPEMGLKLEAPGGIDCHW
jgi:hypothetical protein